MMMGQVETGNFAEQTSAKRAVSVRWLLEWSFQREKAQLEFRADGLGACGYGYISSTAAIIQHEMLGCRVDGGGSSGCHPDADMVADALAVLPDRFGGRRTAAWIAELARSGREPDWMRDATPQVLPVDTRTNRHGVRAKTEDAATLGQEGWPAQPRRNRKGVLVHDVIAFCPVICRPSVSDIARARRAYLSWWSVLLELRSQLQIYGGLSSYEVTNEMPTRAPWSKSDSTKVLTAESLGV